MTTKELLRRLFKELEGLDVHHKEDSTLAVWRGDLKKLKSKYYQLAISEE